MKNERIRIVRVRPDLPPILDEIEISDNNVYQLKTKQEGQLCTYSIELSRSNPELKIVDLENNVIAIFFNINTLTNINNRYYRDIDDYYSVDEEVYRNKDIQEHKIYGDILILGTYTKVEDNKEVEKYKSLTLEQIDQYMEMFKLENKLHIRFNN